MLKKFTYPVTSNNWKNIPTFSGRLATKDDVDKNVAMFCTVEAGEKLYEMDLPFCAIYTEKKTGERFSIIAVQAEAAHAEVVIGSVKISGETIVCLLSELEIVKNPDSAFFSITLRKPWWKLW